MCATVSKILEESVRYLKNHGVENNTVLDAQLILCHVLKVDRLYLVVNRDEELDKNVIQSYQSLLRLRAEGQPLQYITGMQEFMSLPFRLTADVLIPRADTEILVECVINKYKKEDHPTSIMDIGTGSGCIAVSLAYYIQNCSIYAVDISPKALTIAQQNAEENGVSHKISFKQQNILDGFPGCLSQGELDAIISNPPYIKTDVIETLQREVMGYEPHLALDGGKDGLVFYKTITGKAYHYLKSGGLLAFEVGHDQSDEVVHLIENTGKYTDIEVVKDLAGINRVVAARRIK
ncbi:MAG: peptide chain release factor N(5)-glutamine methyltransferase [Clostridia bacterium]